MPNRPKEREYHNAGNGGPGYSSLWLFHKMTVRPHVGLRIEHWNGRGGDIQLNMDQVSDLIDQLTAVRNMLVPAERLIHGDSFLD